MKARFKYHAEKNKLLVDLAETGDERTIVSLNSLRGRIGRARSLPFWERGMLRGEIDAALDRDFLKKRATRLSRVTVIQGGNPFMARPSRAKLQRVV